IILSGFESDGDIFQYLFLIKAFVYMFTPYHSIRFYLTASCGEYQNDDIIRQQYHHVADHYRIGTGFSQFDGSSFHVISLVTGDGGQDKGEDQSFYQHHYHIERFEEGTQSFDIIEIGQVSKRNRSDVTSDDTDECPDTYQYGDNQDRRNNLGHYEITRCIHTHDFHRIDVFFLAHTTYFRRHIGSYLTGQNQSRERRSKFNNGHVPDDITDIIFWDK